MYDHVVVHYSEIGTKSGNRAMFERALARNIAAAAGRFATVDVRRETGRLVFAVPDAARERVDELLAAVALLPGVASAAGAVRTAPTLEAMGATAVRLAARRTGSFKIVAKRSEKALPFDSRDICREVGAAVAAATGRPVDVHTPDAVYTVEVDVRRAYVRDAHVAGPGGLPVGASGRVVALLSGGIDSPVAAYLAMLRGCRVTAVHAWNRSYSGDGVREKLLRLAAALAPHHGPLRLELVPFEGIQQEIVAAAPADVRMLLYRRAMFRIADAVRRERRAGATVVGDAVGQVASQTLANLGAVYAVAAPPVLTPLAGSNKLDVEAVARRIGTYDVSVLPGADCCGLLVARHPRTATTAAELARFEEGYDSAALLKAALAERETHTIAPT